MLVKTGDTGGIICSDNLYNFIDTESTSGFIKTSLSFQKTVSGPGKGLYFRTDSDARGLPEAATPAECGTAWYPNQRSETEAIADKTIFPETVSSTESVQENDSFPFSISKDSDNFFQIISPVYIKDIQIYSLQGLLLQSQTIDHHTGRFYFPHAAGMYILRARLLSYKKGAQFIAAYGATINWRPN